MSNIKIEIDLTTAEIMGAIEDYVHRQYGHLYADMRPFNRTVMLTTTSNTEHTTARVTIEEKNDD